MDVHAIMSGKRKDPLAILLRMITRVGTIPYSIAARLRNRGFDRGTREICRVEVPVISVGNITTGGTGKTPMVALIAKHFRNQGIRVSIVSRGYGAGDEGFNDEAMELEQRLPDVPHVQNPDRVEAAHVVVEELDTQLIILDDGFQHRRLHRDLNIVLIDATCPFGYGYVLPRGLLRESLSGLARADVIVLTRSDAVDTDKQQQIRERCLQHAPDAAWVACVHRPSHLISHGNPDLPISQLGQKKVLAISAIGNPQAFHDTIISCGAEIVDTFTFPDHHRYTREDIEKLAEWAKNKERADALLCTQKDLVKLRTDRLGSLPLFAISIEIEICEGESALKDQFDLLDVSS